MKIVLKIQITQNYKLKLLFKINFGKSHFISIYLIIDTKLLYKQQTLFRVFQMFY